MTDYFDNPSSLKIDLMLRGLRGEETPEGIKPVSGLLGRAGEGVDLYLPGEVLVNVPCGEEYTRTSPYWISGVGRNLTLTDGEYSVKVSLLPVPKFYSKKTTSNIAFSDIATVHGSYVVITPSPKCEFFNTSVECKYCAGNYDLKGEAGQVDPPIFSVEDILETVDAVLKEGKSEIIYLSIGFSSGDDGGIEFLAPYVEAIKKRFNCLVAVEALPPKHNKWIDETYAVGADSVLYNLEIYDPELFKVICPGRADLIGRERYLDALKYAAKIFPNGTVASHLIVGLEPPGATAQGIDFLTEHGVVPILPIYRPRAGKALRIEPLDTEIILPVYKKLYTAIKRHGINMNWVRDISSVTTPVESRELAGEKSSFTDSLVESFYKSKFGLKTAWGLSTLRRKLRVRPKDPLDGPKPSKNKE